MIDYATATAGDIITESEKVARIYADCPAADPGDYEAELTRALKGNIVFLVMERDRLNASRQVSLTHKD